MPERIREAFEQAMAAARALEADGDLAAAWSALERAHVLSQSWALPHVRNHAAMLGLAWRTWDGREVVGQVLRLVLAAPASLLGRAPLGNRGRSNVGILTPQPVDEELAALLWPDRPQS